MTNAKSRKRRKILVFTAIFLALAGLTTWAFLRKREVVITVQTEKVARRNLTEVVVANGRVQPVIQVVIQPEVSGEIIELPVREAQPVKMGDLLVKIKPDNYRAVRNSAEASVRSALAGQTLAMANLRKAEVEFERYRQLHETKLISDSQFTEALTSLDVMRASYETATNQLDHARASLAKADDDLAKTTIYAPTNGAVTRLRSQVGERVVGTALMAGTEIMTIANLEEMEARVDIGEVDIVLIQIGQQARLEVDAFRDRKFTGVVTEIANASKSYSASSMASSIQSQEATKFEVKIRIREKELFRPGMSVTAEIETRYRTNVLSVPIQSVTSRLPKQPDEKGKPAGSTHAAPATNPGPSTVEAASTNSPRRGESKKPGDGKKPVEVVFLHEGERVKMAPVKRGISDDIYVEILEGLKEGQEVVSGGYKAINRELEDGKKIKIGEPPKEEEPTKKP